MKTLLSDRVSMTPNICHGKPVVTGTRVLVSQVVGALAGGDPVETVLADYPSISREDVQACLSFAGALAGLETAVA